jgi:hypothetical protein
MIFQIVRLVYEEWEFFRPWWRALVYVISCLSKTEHHYEVWYDHRMIGYLGVGKNENWVSRLFMWLHPWERVKLPDDTPAVTLFVVSGRYKYMKIGSALWSLVPEGALILTDDECNVGFYEHRCDLLMKRSLGKIDQYLFKKNGSKRYEYRRRKEDVCPE